VTTVELGKVNLEVDQILGSVLFLVVKLENRNQTAGATHRDDTVILAVKVQQIVAAQHVGLDVAGTRQTGLLVDCGQSLHRTALDVGVGDGCKSDCQTHAVVGTQRGVVGANPLTVNDGLDRVVVKVVVRRRCLLGNHVHVTLQDHTLGILKAGGCRTEHGDVANLIDLVLEVVLFCEVNKPSLDFCQTATGAGHLRNLIKDLPHACRFQIFYGHNCDVIKKVRNVSYRYCGRNIVKYSQKAPLSYGFFLK